VDYEEGLNPGWSRLCGLAIQVLRHGEQLRLYNVPLGVSVQGLRAAGENMGFAARAGTIVLSVIAPLMSVAVCAQGDAITAETGRDQDARIERVERGLPAIPPSETESALHLSLEQLMQRFEVPGLSVAVIDNFRIVWAKGYGVKEVGSRVPVTVRTIFEAGSISKAVSATGALTLVEQGKISLDENVNVKLKSWQVPNNEFTSEQKVTLRRILSHSAGLTVHGFAGYPVGSPIPTLVQVLNGTPPANSEPVRVAFVPGTKYSYSGGGVMVEQMLITDVTGETFPQFMQESVLKRVGMLDSTYEQPLPPSRLSMAAVGTDSSGKSIVGKWHIYPEMAAAGLWTTATDLAKFAIDVALSKRGKVDHVLSQAITREMLTPQIDHRGLGFAVGDYDNPEEFEHAGDDAGFNAVLIMFADSGKGVAIMSNSDNGHDVEEYLIRSVAKEYGWRYHPDPGSSLPRSVMMR
jgi:CubicO group peptidase (beta-lactamase class C family)